MNPLKCAFGLKAENFLRFLVHQRGVEVDHNKAKDITEAKPPTNKRSYNDFLDSELSHKVHLKPGRQDEGVQRPAKVKGG